LSSVHNFAAYEFDFEFVAVGERKRKLREGNDIAQFAYISLLFRNLKHNNLINV